jgi:plastocyanin
MRTGPFPSGSPDQARGAVVPRGAGVLIALLAFATMLALAPASASAQVTHQVNASGFAWDVTEVNATVGDTVEWDFSGGSHDVCIDQSPPVGATGFDDCTGDEFIASSLDGDTGGQKTFTEPGSYLYYCSLHEPSMRGTVEVTEGGGPDPQVAIESAPSQIKAKALLRRGLRVGSSCAEVELGTLQLYATGRNARKLGIKKKRAVLARANVSCGASGEITTVLKPTNGKVKRGLKKLRGTARSTLRLEMSGESVASDTARVTIKGKRKRR